MADCASLEQLINRLSLESLFMSVVNLTGEIDPKEIMTGADSLATAIVIKASGNLVEYVKTGSIEFKYGEVVDFGTSEKSGNVNFVESTLITDLIKGSTDIIEKYTSRKFGDGDLPNTQFFQTCSDDTEIELDVSKGPLVSVTSVELNGSSIGVEDTDYWVNLEVNEIQVLQGTFPNSKPKALKVVYIYTTGAEVPPGIQTICQEMIVNVWDDYQKERNQNGAESISVAGYSSRFVKKLMLSEGNMLLLDQYSTMALSAH